jgi:Zn-dependent protease
MLNLSLTTILLRAPAILIGLVFHEFAHAWVADRLGDKTPRYQGRLSISPQVHLDPIGFILAVIIGFGWARPVEINPRNLRNIRRDNALISVAGPISNFIVAFITAVVMKILILAGFGPSYDSNVILNLHRILDYIVWVNILLGIFNLLPIPPLDGSHLLESFTNIERFNFYHIIRQYSSIILILLLVSNIAARIIIPPANYLYTNVYNIVGINLLEIIRLHML